MKENRNISKVVKNAACAGVVLLTILLFVYVEMDRRKERAARNALESHVCNLGDSSACALVMLYAHRYDLVEQVLERNVERTNDLIDGGEIVIDDHNEDEWLRYRYAVLAIERARKKWPKCSESLKSRESHSD